MEYLMRDYSVCPICSGMVRYRQDYYECMDCRKVFIAVDEGISDSELTCTELEKEEERLCV